MRRIFLLSPASASGRRAGHLLRPEADFELARRFWRTGAPLGEVFTFLSGLYFRGKLAYARRFGAGEVLVITPTRGLLPPEESLTPERLREFAEVEVDEGNPRYCDPLVAAACRLRAGMGSDDRVILLGSIATAKYRAPLGEVLGARLFFPSDFVGRGDMSRGALLLQRAAAGEELAYLPVAGAAVFSLSRAAGIKRPKALRRSS